MNEALSKSLEEKLKCEQEKFASKKKQLDESIEELELRFFQFSQGIKA